MPVEITNGNAAPRSLSYLPLCPRCKNGVGELEMRPNPMMAGVSCLEDMPLVRPTVYEFICGNCSFSPPWALDIETAAVFWMTWKRGL